MYGVFNATFNNILAVVSREKHWSATSHWQTLSSNVVSLIVLLGVSNNGELYIL